MRFFVKNICIEVSVNFALEFSLQYQVPETLLRCQIIFFRLVALVDLLEFQPAPFSPHANFQKKIFKTSILNHGDIILNPMHSISSFACLDLSFNPLSANFTKWSNRLKQFVGLCLSVFGHFVGLALKGLRHLKFLTPKFPLRDTIFS